MNEKWDHREGRRLNGRLALAVCALLVVLGDASAQSCWGPVARGAVAPLGAGQTARWEWREREGQVDLLRNGRQVGAYHLDHKVYRRLTDYQRNTWSGPEAPPIALPSWVASKTTVIEQPAENFGLDVEKTKAESREGYRLGDQEISRERAFEAVQTALPDHSKKLYLTVIGTADQQKQFEQQWAAAEAELRDSFVLRCGSPADFWLKDNDTGATVFQTNGSPTVYMQAPDGKVLWRQEDAGGAIEAARKVRKQYDPRRDPGPRPGPVPEPGGVPTAAWVVFGALVLLLLFKK